MPDPGDYGVIYWLSSMLIMLAVLLCFLRICIGPTLADRVVALDLIVNMVISWIAIYSVITGRPIYIDVIIAMALIIFLGTVSFARFIELQSYRKRKKNG